MVEAVRRSKGEGGAGVELNHMTTRELASLKIVQYSVVRTILAQYPFLNPTGNILSTLIQSSLSIVMVQ